MSRAPVVPGIAGALTLVIDGAPRTKKTSNRIVRVKGSPRIIPSESNDKWNASAQMQLARFRSSTDWKLPLRCAVNCKALFLRDADRGDFLGYAQALADALQEGGIVENDVLIKSWDGSRMLVDKVLPRVIVRLEPA